MLPRPRSIASLLALLVVSAGLLAGCGGGGESGSPEGDGGGQQQQGQSEKETQETKIAIGDVVSVKPEKRRLVLRPTEEIDGESKIAVNVRKTAKITLGGQEAEMSDIAEGQQAQAEYVVKNDVNRAISVQLFEAEDQSN